MPVVLLCHCDGANGSTTFTDVSPSAHTLTPTSTTVTTTSPKFGTGSADFTASSAAAIDTGNAAVFNLGAGQFTVEAWVYVTGTISGTRPIVSQWGPSGNLGWVLSFGTTTVGFNHSTTGSDAPGVSVSFTPTLNTWYHVAADRDATNTVRVYVNGAVSGSGAAAVTIFASTYTCMIGNDHNNNRGFPGRIDEVRVTKGTAQYAGAFTPPTGPFPDGAVTAAQARVMVLA